jgi:hypothetical protein
METWKKIAVGTVIGGVLIGGTVYIARLSAAGAELETVPMVRIHKLDLSGLTIRVDVQLKNPTRTPLKLKFPFIKLIYREASIGSSQVIDQDISIPAFGEAIINEIMIRIPMLSLFSLSGGLIQAIQNKEAVVLEIKTLTTIDLGWKKMPFDNSNTITLSLPSA